MNLRYQNKMCSKPATKDFHVVIAFIFTILNLYKQRYHFFQILVLLKIISCSKLSPRGQVLAFRWQVFENHHTSNLTFDALRCMCFGTKYWLTKILFIRNKSQLCYNSWICNHIDQPQKLFHYNNQIISS